MSHIVHFIFDLQTNIKLYHWMTTSYARHKAADNLVSEVLNLGDKLVEVYIGKYGRPIINKKDTLIQLQNLNDKNIIKYIDDAVNYLIEDMPKNLKKNDVDLLNIRDELVAILHQTKYLFSFE
jgi:hypothetical protein